MTTTTTTEKSTFFTVLGETTAVGTHLQGMGSAAFDAALKGRDDVAQRAETLDAKAKADAKAEAEEAEAKAKAEADEAEAKKEDAD